MHAVLRDHVPPSLKRRIRAVGLGARLTRLAATPLEALRIAAAAVVLSERSGPGGRWLRVELRLGGKRVPFVAAELSELAVLEEVFLLREYELERPCDPDTILDLGSHVGASVLWFRGRYPRARIVAVEPDPLVFARLRFNTSTLGRVELHNVAISDEAGTVTLWRGNQTWGTAIDRWWPGQTTSVTVPARTVDQVVSDAGLDQVDLLKVDIEGAEYRALPGFKAIGGAQVVIGELHPYLSEQPVEAFLECLDGFDVQTWASGEFVRFQAYRRG